MVALSLRKGTIHRVRVTRVSPTESSERASVSLSAHSWHLPESGVGLGPLVRLLPEKGDNWREVLGIPDL